MALTPDDVVTKQFQHVRFKDGLDPDEVDDFLDEIVVEWRKTLAENEELKAKLAAYESGAAAPAAAPATPAPAVPVPVPAAATPAEAVAAPAAAGVSQPTTETASIIELAQRLHDEHVAEGEAKAKKIVTDAEEKARKTISEMEAKRREETERLERERNTLEGRIAELREFEREYRTNLRSYIEGQLRDLDEKPAVTGGAPGSNNNR